MGYKVPLVMTAAILLAVYTARSFSGSPQESKRMNHQDRRPIGSNLPQYSAGGYSLEPLGEQRMKESVANLSPDERRILLEEGTERAFSGALVENKKEGVYVCRLCGLPLYDSDTKFKSGTGWPSFFRPFDPAHVREVADGKHGMSRTEVECARCRSHLGHVFNDGPRPTGLRYCMNSAALKFYEKGASLPPMSRPAEKSTAYFAGGCFWGIEDRFQQVAGVIEAVSGYQGGQLVDPSYKQVCRGDTGHAETVRVTYDPEQVTYVGLLEWFLKFHDPTQKDRQGPDVGTQYRSAIFAADDKQLAQAREFIAVQSNSERFGGRKIATIVEKAGPFYVAEEYHQDYHAKHGGSCSISQGE